MSTEKWTKEMSLRFNALMKNNNVSAAACFLNGMDRILPLVFEAGYRLGRVTPVIPRLKPAQGKRGPR